MQRVCLVAGVRFDVFCNNAVEILSTTTTPHARKNVVVRRTFYDDDASVHNARGSHRTYRSVKNTYATRARVRFRAIRDERVYTTMSRRLTTAIVGTAELFRYVLFA